MLIGIAGRIQHGKSTAADILVQVGREAGLEFTVDSWARLLREMLEVLTGVPVNRTLTETDKNTPVSVTRSPVTELFPLAKQFLHDHGYHLSPPDVTCLTEAMAHFHDGLVQQLEWTPRQLLQFLGTDCLRKLFDPDIWVKLQILDWQQQGCPNRILGDCRFPNEISMLRQCNGYVFRVVRPDLPARPNEHESERSLDHVTLPVIENPMTAEFSTRLQDLFMVWYSKHQSSP